MMKAKKEPSAKVINCLDRLEAASDNVAWTKDRYDGQAFGHQKDSQTN